MKKKFDPVIGPSWMRPAPECEYPPLPPVSERGAEVRKRLAAVLTAIMSHRQPEEEALRLLFRAELEMRVPERQGEPISVEQLLADLADASERGAMIKEYLRRALVAFDELGSEDRIAILSAFDGRPFDPVSLQVSLPEAMPDLPPPGPIPYPDGAPGEVLRRIDQVLRQIDSTPFDDDNEQRKLRNVLGTALGSGFPGAMSERPDWPIFAPGTRGAKIMPPIRDAVAAFDALADTDRRTVLRWLNRRLIRVTQDIRLDDDQN